MDYLSGFKGPIDKNDSTTTAATSNTSSFIQLCSKCGLRGVAVFHKNKSLSVLCNKCRSKMTPKSDPVNTEEREIDPTTPIPEFTKISMDDIKSYATAAPGKHDDWLKDPLSPDLITVPGIGSSGINILKSVGITTTWHLIAKYMNYGPGGIKKFNDFLSQFSGFGSHKDTITRAIAEKVAISFGH